MAKGHPRPLPQPLQRAPVPGAVSLQTLLRAADEGLNQVTRLHSAGRTRVIGEDQQVAFLLDREGPLAHPSTGPPLQPPREKRVHGFAAVAVVVVGGIKLPRAHALLSAVQPVHGAHGRVLHIRSIDGPVAGSGHQQEGTRRSHSRDLYVVDFQTQVALILTGTPSLKVSGHHVDAGGGTHAIVHGRQQERLRASP